MRKSKLKILLEGIAKIIEKIKCKLICCYSSCNQKEDIPPSSPVFLEKRPQKISIKKTPKHLI